MNHTNYIITGPGRCGSTMVRTALENHPEVDSYYEFLKKRICEKFDRTYEEQRKFLYNLNKKARGCVAFYHHLPNDSAWDWFRANAEIINLIRQDAGRWHLSMMIAKNKGISQNGSWDLKDESDLIPLENRRVKIDIKKMRREVSDYKNNIQWAREKFDVPNYHEFSYEMLKDYWNETISKIEDILNVDNIPIYPKTKRANKESIDQLVINSEEFKKEYWQSEYWIKLQ